MADTPDTKRSLVDFAAATVGDDAYTWQFKSGDSFGEYSFETAGDPREFYATDGEVVVRKRWRLIEIAELGSEATDG